MKSKLLILTIFLNTTFCFSQLPLNYPFKAISNSEGVIFVAGQKEIDDDLNYSVVKLPIVGSAWEYYYENSVGNDRAMDVALNKEDNTVYLYSTGFVLKESGNTEILTVKLSSSRDLIWEKKYTLPNQDCKAFGIALDSNDNVWVSGYATINNKKSLLVLKYSYIDGTLLATHIYSNPNFSGDNVGTSIMTDAGNVYVMGYTDNGPVNKRDALLWSYNFQMDEVDVNIYALPGNQTPTGFKFAQITRMHTQKSRVVVTSVSDMIINTAKLGTEFFTAYYDGGNKNSLRWTKSFRRKNSPDNVPTSIDVDKEGSIYVAGYTRSKFSSYDFTAVKYLSTGKYGWEDTASYFDELSGNDKASSIRVHDRYVYLTGPSENAPGSYKTVAYSQIETSRQQLWAKSFTPSFMSTRTPGLEHASILCLDTINGVLSTVAMQWGNNPESASNFAVQSYDSSGNVLFTYDENENSGDLRSAPEVSAEGTDRISSQNFPNPFNPSTMIKFILPSEGIVKIKVYDIAGKEVAVLTDGFMNKGHHEVEFNSSHYTNLTSGIYFYRIESGYFSEVRKMMLVK